MKMEEEVCRERGGDEMERLFIYLLLLFFLIISGFVFLLFLFKTHLDLNSCDFLFLILFLIFF